VYEEPVFAPPAEPEPVPEPAAEEPFAPAASAEPAEGQIQDMNGAAPPPPPPATRGTLGDGLRPIGETPLVDYSLGAFDLDHIGRTPEPPPVAPPAPAQQPSPEQQSAPPPAAHEDAEPEGALLPFELTLRLADGERMVLGKFATEDEAQGGARTFAEQLKDNEWPNVNGRMIRREAIVSIDIEQNDAPGWAGSGNRGPWRDT
jgi:hypothetical protein